MIFPNKALRFEESALSKVGLLLAQGPQPVGLQDLYNAVAHRFESIDQFILALDILFVLGRIELNQPTRTIFYAD